MTDYDDLCKRLRPQNGRATKLESEAADAIAALREQVAAKDADMQAILNGAGAIVGSITDAASEGLDNAAVERHALIVEGRKWQVRAEKAEAENAALREQIDALTESECDKIMMMTDDQIRALSAVQGSSADIDALKTKITIERARRESAEADNAALREQVEAFRREQIARSKIDPVTRLHNLCDGLAESRHESPYDQASWDLADADNKQLRARAEKAEAENAALRELLKEARDELDVDCYDLRAEIDALLAGKSQ